MKGGVVGGIPTPGNVLNPDVLFKRLESLEQNRATLRSDIGLAEGEDMQAVFGDTAEWT